MTTPTTPRSPAAARAALNRLEGRRDALKRQREAVEADLRQKAEFLEITDEVKALLEKLGEQMFQKVIGTIQTQLSRGLREVLDQPIQLKVEQGERAGQVTLKFYIERVVDGEAKREDIMRGQGGSVVNVLSVGLRLLALSAAESKEHRRFLILDEQDCWIRPDLVPRLVQIVRDAGKMLGFQVLMVSHHDSGMFQRYADRMYRCEPKSDVNGQYVDVALVPDGRAGDDAARAKSSGSTRKSADAKARGAEATGLLF